jgi:hypothetical protein
LARDLRHLRLYGQVVKPTHHWDEGLEWPWPLQQHVDAAEGLAWLASHLA